MYKNYYRAMVTLCLRYTRNEHDAVEVLNTGFFKVFRNMESYQRGKASLYTWIRTIIVNSCLDFIKSREKMETHQELGPSVDVHIPAEALLKMNADELLVMVRQLPASTQAVFNLYVIEGYSHKEIAKMMNISEGTSKWHLSEARKTLKIRWEEAQIHG
ncbi:MAG: RNA polymerase sigma factor [Flavisolibacter sp.]